MNIRGAKFSGKHGAFKRNPASDNKINRQVEKQQAHQRAKHSQRRQVSPPQTITSKERLAARLERRTRLQRASWVPGHIGFHHTALEWYEAELRLFRPNPFREPSQIVKERDFLFNLIEEPGHVDVPKK